MALRIEKDETGNTWTVSHGVAGSPFYSEVTGLDARQADSLGRVIAKIEDSTRRETQRQIREALGISEKAAK